MSPRRFIHLLWGLAVYFIVLSVIGWLALACLMWDADVASVIFDPETWIGLSVIPAAISVIHILVLFPVIRFRRGRSNLGKPLVVSASMLGLLTAGVTVGAVSGIIELFGPWGTSDGAFGSQRAIELGEFPWFAGLFWTILGASWCIWTFVFWRFVGRGSHPSSRIGRLIGIIVGGSVVEALAIIPIDIMVRRRTDCYCNTGTFFALFFSLIAVVCLSGPGLFILLSSKRRRAWYELNCAQCGYAKGPQPFERCPECGHLWNAQPR